MKRLIKVITPALFFCTLAGCAGYVNHSDNLAREHLRTHTYSSSDVVSYVKYNCAEDYMCERHPRFNKNINDDILELERRVPGSSIKTFDVEGLKGFLLELNHPVQTFDYGDDKLSEKLKLAMAGIAKSLVGSEYTYKEVVVVGHASYDDESSRAKSANIIESINRAKHAANYLAVSLAEYGSSKKANNFIKSQGAGDKYATISKLIGKQGPSKYKKQDQRTDIVFILDQGR